ncbi:Tetratricopeptide-like helical domain protein [Rutstroemia sp. NJR-2017a WRK4]|nr:Tetratricopeptide-like helical domain protein [Rutstroemia sp. NJR-2017a WRK4]
MEIVGTVAACTELVKQCASLISFIRRVKVQMRDGPEYIQAQIQRLERLDMLVSCITQNPSLQGRDETPVLASHLESCLGYAKDLEICLEENLVVPEDGKMKKIEKAIRSVRAEAKIESLLCKIDRERGNLTLTIQNIDASLLQDVRTNTRDMKFVVDGLASDFKDVKSMINSHIKSVSNPISGPKISAQRHFIIPNRRVTGLLGREDILTRIEDGLSSGPGPRIVVLRGLGGQGKTQVALEYCQRAKKNEAQSIFWVDATSAGTVKKDFAVIYERLKGTHNATGDSEKVQFVLDILEQWSYPWLVVFDNHDDPGSFHLPDYIPSGENGQILITSRHADIGQLAEQDFDIQLPGLPKEDALDLLIRHSRANDPTSRDDGYAIIDRLGYHALAIVQAGSFIQSQKIRLSQFMEVYNHQREAILRQTPKISPYRRKLGDAEDETALNVFTTWELSFKQLETHDDEKKSKSIILTLFAFFDRQGISHHLFKTYCARRKVPDPEEPDIQKCLSSLLHEGKWDERKFVDLLNNLSELSLIQNWSRDSDDTCHLSLHPLVWDWIRLRISPELCFDYTVVSMDILYEVMQNSYSASRQYFRMPLPLQQEIHRHLVAYEENRGLLASFGLNSDDASSHCLYQYVFAKFCYDSGLFEHASLISERVSQLYLAKYGADACRYHDSRSLLSLSLIELRDPERAMEIGQETCNFFSRSFGPEHPYTLSTMENLAYAMYQNGDLTEAKKICKQTIEIQNRVLGPNHSWTLSTTAVLAIIIHEEGDLAASEEYFRALLRAADTHNKADRNEHLVMDLNYRLGVVLYQQYKCVEALGFLETASSGRLDLFGPDHENYLSCKKLYLRTLEEIELLKEGREDEYGEDGERPEDDEDEYDEDDEDDEDDEEQQPIARRDTASSDGELSVTSDSDASSDVDEMR